MPKTVLVAGATGYLGKFAVCAFKARGYRDFVSRIPPLTDLGGLRNKFYIVIRSRPLAGHFFCGYTTTFAACLEYVRSSDDSRDIWPGAVFAAFPSLTEARIYWEGSGLLGDLTEIQARN